MRAVTRGSKFLQVSCMGISGPLKKKRIQLASEVCGAWDVRKYLISSQPIAWHSTLFSSVYMCAGEQHITVPHVYWLQSPIA